jgi:MFS family permease
MFRQLHLGIKACCSASRAGGAWCRVAVTLLFGITLGTGASANQTALYTQVPAAQIGTASGLFRTFGYLGSIASSAIIAITFRTSVSDHGLHVIAVIMIAVSAVALLITLADRQLMTLATAGQVSPASQEPERRSHDRPQRGAPHRGRRGRLSAVQARAAVGSVHRPRPARQHRRRHGLGHVRRDGRGMGG